MRFRLHYLFICLSILSVTNCFSQNVTFSRLSINDGLSTNFVNAVCQDKKGFLWVGTESGLQRYDGNSFANINSADSAKRLPGFSVDQLLPDTQRNVIWVRMGSTVGRFNTDKGEFVKADISLKIFPNGTPSNFLKKDSKNNIIWIIQGAGAFVYNDKKNLFEENKDIISVPPHFSLLNLYEDAVNNWMYLCGNEGLKIYDQRRKIIYDSANNPLNIPIINLTKNLSYVQYIFIDSKKRFWIDVWPPLGRQDMFVLNSKENKLNYKPLEVDIPEYAANFNLFESNNLIFCYGVNILNLYSESDGIFYKFYQKNNANSGIRFSVIKDIYEDRNKNVWVISDNGLYQAIISSNYKYYSHINALQNAPVTYIQNLPDNTVFCTSWGAGVAGVKYKNSNGLKVTEDNVNTKLINQINKLAENKGLFWSSVYDSTKHQLIIGCQQGKIIKADIEKNTAVLLKPDIFKSSTVRQVTQDNDGNYWYGTQSGKVIKEANGVYSLVADYNNAFITKLMIDKKDRLWVCTGGSGLKIIDIKTNKNIASYNADANAKNTIASNEVGDVMQLNDSIFILILVRNFDLFNINTNTFKHITTNEGLPNNTLYTALKDKHNNVWFSSNEGIIKYNYYKNEFHVYNKKDGMISVANNDDLLYVGRNLNNDYLMFAGARSRYLIFNPDSVGNRSTPKDVSITDIRLFNKYLPVDSILQAGGLNLTHEQNTITINFTVLSYGANTLSYFYRLRGSSDEWIRASKPYSASYASLSSGEYTFEVKCINENGTQSKHITSLNINISKAFWQTWWFIALLIIAAIIPFYIIYKLRINRFKAIQKMREKVARDLHDDVGSTLTSINILSEISKNKVDDNTEVKEYLNRISNTSSQMMDAMDDIVWNIKPANDTMEKIEARMREYAAAVLDPKDIAYKFIDNAKIKAVSLNMDIRRSLFLIFKETLNNIAKYAEANLVIVQFELKNMHLILTITDDGIGFDEKTIRYGNGIENMQKRARSFKGSFTIQSVSGKGTNVVLVIPLLQY